MADLKEQWARYQATGSAEVRGELILACMPLVRYAVGRILPGLPPSLDREDLMEAGVFGLIDAIERFDPSREAKFESYAILRIRGAVLDELRANEFNPRTVRLRLKRAEEIRNGLQERYRGTPAEKHLEEALEPADDEPVQVVSFVSLHGRASGRRRVVDEIVDARAGDAEAEAELDEARAALAQALDGLPSYERAVVAMYYYKGMMLKEIGRVFKVTESRISQVHQRALRRLRTQMKSYA